MNFKQILKFNILYFAFCILFPCLVFAKVSDTKHNLSVSGPGPVQAVEEIEICKFCHTPHNAKPVYPLWNHDLSAVVNYKNYESASLQSYRSEAEAPPIDGFSLLCLSCHDGTVAVGAVVMGPVENREEDIQMVTIPGIIEEGKLQPGAAGYLGTDLSGGHPISIVFDAALKTKRDTVVPPLLMRLNWPINDPDVKLYPTQGRYGIQCPSCHDPHGSKAPPTGPPLWRKTTYDDVCLVCHDVALPGEGH